MKRLNLDNVTIVAIDCIRQDEASKALRYSMKDIDFGKSKFFSNIKPKTILDSTEFIQIEKLTHETYSVFVLHELHKYIDTEYCLIVHDDGFVINSHLWNDEFLNYDYIGAPWYHTIPHYGHIYRVGNGGFSLRSKKLLDLCANLPVKGHEDSTICLKYRPYLESRGCKFAPVEVAMKFSLEEKIPECEFDLNNTFGFHGRGDPDHDPSQGFYWKFKEKIKLLESID